MHGRSRLFSIGLILIASSTISSAADRKVVADSAVAQPPASSIGKLFRLEYHKSDLSFCNSTVCVDFDGDGKRELLFASRKTKQLQLLNATDGTIIWSKKLAGDQQSISAFDLDHDGDFEILYTVSSPGRLYVMDHAGNVLRTMDSGDWKL